ncbi:hypothetical protein EDB19DRAFT_1964808 [Suillus lakei]|nr:hypothetical protein EDB19DRAFT_1964808 [Suillus lakei]
MAETRVIIVGAGIASPVLAVFLKTRGYHPVIYERLPGPGEGGLVPNARHRLRSNGIRVLSLIPELLEHIPGHSPDRTIHCSCLNEEQNILVDSNISPASMRGRFGFPNIGVQRTEFQRLLIDTAEKHSIEIKWDHQAIEFDQSEDAVEVTFANGAKDTASFVIGCDRLHSNTRIALFGKDKANFTGMVRVNPFRLALLNNYGDDRHQTHHIAHPCCGGQIFMGVSASQIPVQGLIVLGLSITTRGADAKKDWRTQHVEQHNEVRKGPLSAWGFGAGDLVKAGQKIMKYGLYDRPELKSWFKGRIVLLGDAAHPTSPTFTILMKLLRKHNPSANQLSTELLSRVFTDFQNIRLLRTSELVRGREVT